MRALHATALVHEGPIARAYLARLRQSGYLLDRILLLVYRGHAVSRKPLGRWLPLSVRRRYAEAYQRTAYNAWPVRLRGLRPDLVAAIVEGLGPLCPDADRLVDEMTGRFDYARYANRVERLFVSGLADPLVAEALSRCAPGVVLFTGGGIVPPPILEIPGLRLLHVHPGHLPHVRGADGLLWSTLVRGRPGATCFFLARGIDTGDIVDARDLPPLVFRLAPGNRPDDQTLYRALYSFCDPLLRAQALVGLLDGRGGEVVSLSATPQVPRQGLTYHFMHPALRHRAMERLFPSVVPRVESRP